MSLYRASLQSLGAIALLVMALACKGKSSSTPQAAATTAVISGVVTYDRVPLVKDAQGVPIGLADATVATNLKNLPARGVFIRIYQQVDQTQPNGTIKPIWLVARSGMTDSAGAYVLTVTKDRPTIVEVLSTFSAGSDKVIHLIAEPTTSSNPGGINSPTLALNRQQYGMRKAVDGTTSTTDPVHATVLSADTIVKFNIGLNDEWWIVDPDFRLSSTESPNTETAVLETTFSGRTPGLGTGSRVLGIGDSIASFVSFYGSATPGATVDLHYWPGQSEPRGSYIEYDRSLFPQAFDPSTGIYRFFGTLRGGPANDDAWDEGVIFPMLARNQLFAGNSGRTFSTQVNPLLPIAAALTNLSPDMARIEGLADAMAANLLKSPYLADTQGTGLAAPVRDIRDLGGLSGTQLSPYSAPALRALSWEIILKANSLPSPGTSANWDTINTTAATRFFQPPTALTNGATDTTARDIEPLNIYSQLKRLSETKSTAEPADLAALFTDAVLTPMTAAFNITWPRPSTGAYALFVKDWGTDPNSLTTALAPVTLSMATATQVNGAYPNVSLGEVFYSGFSLTADKRYILTATISPALGAGAQIDLDLPRLARTFSFTGSGGSTDPVVLPVTFTPPVYHPVRLRLKSSGSLQPDVSMTLAFTPAP